MLTRRSGSGLFTRNKDRWQTSKVVLGLWTTSQLGSKRRGDNFEEAFPVRASFPIGISHLAAFALVGLEEDGLLRGEGRGEHVEVRFIIEPKGAIAEIGHPLRG